MKKLYKIMLLVILTFCSYRILNKLRDYNHANSIYKEIAELKYNNNLEDTKEGSKPNDIIDLRNINNDYVGWININNTNIDYPVLQSKDNSYYLNKDLYKNELASGSIFLDYRNNFFNDKHSIIYGHHMRNNTMFGQLDNFKDKLFFDTNKIISISTPTGENLQYEIFSVYTTDASKNNYTKTSFNSDTEYFNYLIDLQNKSMFSCNQNFNIDDKILTLSTCSYEFEDARTVVHARLITSN